MKKALLFLTAALLFASLCACEKAPEAPVPPADMTPAEAAALTDDAAAALNAILTDISDNYQPGTAGCSLTAARLAGELLDWQAAYQPEADAVSAAMGAFFDTLSADAKLAFPALFDGISSASGELYGDTAADLLDTAGYEPLSFPWAEEDGRALCDALAAGIPCT